jgi:transketolase
MGAADILASQGVNARVVSVPCRRLFMEQSEAYREAVLPRSVRARVAVEAACSFGWYELVGLDGTVVCLDRFGASAPAPVLFEQFGFTAQNVAERARSLVGDHS